LDAAPNNTVNALANDAAGALTSAASDAVTSASVGAAPGITSDAAASVPAVVASFVVDAASGPVDSAVSVAVDAAAALTLDAAASDGGPECPLRVAYAAGVVHEGDLVIAGADDLDAAGNISEVTGDVHVLPSYAGVVDLPNLRKVGGSVRVSGEISTDAESVIWPELTELRLPNLTSIGGELYVYLTDALVETDFRSLERVGAQVYFMRNLALRRVGFDSLVEASVQIQAAPVLAACEIDQVCAQVGGVSCGAEYSDPDCTCQVICGRVESSC